MQFAPSISPEDGYRVLNYSGYGFDDISWPNWDAYVRENFQAD